MKSPMRVALLSGLISAMVANQATACTVCMGGNGTLGEAANGAIFVMLGVLGCVLGLIVLAGYSVVKRGNLPMPPHAELARAISNSNVK
jgi:flagellar biogenesis protein FliO